MTEYEFDDSLKNKIRDHRSPVPDDMWERIIQKKDKDRKGFLFFFRWFGLLILAVCLGGYLLMNHTKQKPVPANHAISSQDQKPGQVIPRLNEEVRTENNSGTDVQQPQVGNRGSHYSGSTGALKENVRNFRLFRDKKVDSEEASKGGQSSYLPKDNPTSGIGDSLSGKPPAIIKPVVTKSPTDTSQIIPVKKTQTDSSKITPVKKTQKDSITNKKWYLDIYASPDYPIDHTAYTSSNFINEQMKLSYTVGLRINRAFGKHFSAKLGIQFSQLNFTLKADTFGLQATNIHLKSFDLPFLAGYSFGTEKLKMTVTAGGIANLYSFTRDSVLSIFKTNTGFSLYLGFNLEKKINQKISIYLEPYYRYRLTSMTVNTVDYVKFIDVIGLSFGARFYFLKPTKK